VAGFLFVKENGGPKATVAKLVTIGKSSIPVYCSLSTVLLTCHSSMVKSGSGIYLQECRVMAETPVIHHALIKEFADDGS
jgi:hypothetical protein